MIPPRLRLSPRQLGLVIGLLLFVSGISIFVIYQYVVKARSVPQMIFSRLIVDIIETNKQIHSIFGYPIKIISYPNQQLNEHNHADTTYIVNVQGSIKSGSMIIVASHDDDIWIFKSIVAEVSSTGQRIEIKRNQTVPAT